MDNRLQQDERSTPTDFGEIFVRTGRVGMFRIGTDPPPERRSTISSMLPCSYQNTRMRNLSGGSNGSTASGSSSGSSTQLDNHVNFLMDLTHNSSSDISANRGSSSHRKIDRSCSDNENDRAQRSVNSSRYKTELCRPFEESGSCKYGDKCQFAHGYHELRNLARHPKYKTELCRTFHTVGFCPYGPRCHFVHEDESKPPNSSPKLGRDARNSTSGSSSPSLSPSGSDFSVFTYQTENNTNVTPSNMDNRQYKNSLPVNVDYNKRNSDLHILNERFSGMKLDSNIFINDNVFRSNNNNEPRLIGSEERDIFSEITMFNSEDVQLDNAPKVSTSNAQQSMKLDNLSYMDTHPAYWQSTYNYYSQMMRSVDSSPVSSDGSSNGSNHGGSTESLTSQSFTNWHSQVAIGQY